ncbi:tetratricopeptide repeat protein [uncultured Kordia sp.]|uniref:tetratricopeptide repeat protein n=1 Tax=uncultured Kordia sp. TaxID=507699 RepID=UPI00260C13EE|nr:tetratricopeptide repeat protein [uncultured Kordia sp.]
MNNYRIAIIIVILTLTSLGIAQSDQKQYVSNEERIKTFLKKINDTTISDSLKYVFSKDAYILLDSVQHDSLKNKVLKNCVRYSYKIGDKEKMRKYITEHIQIAEQYGDSLAWARSLYYGGYYHYIDKTHPDSTYYYFAKSSEVFARIGDSLGAGKALLNIAISQKKIGVDGAALITSIDALKFFEGTNQKRRIASIYNNIGLIYKHQKNWKEALKYNLKAYDLRKNLDNTFYYLQTLNNIGIVYSNTGDFKLAHEYFDEALAYDSLLSQPKKRWLKATLIDNKAKAYFRENPKPDVLPAFMRALDIHTELQRDEGMLVVYIHLAEYYKAKNDLKNARMYAEKADSLAEQKNLYRHHLESLELLIDVYPDNMIKTVSKRHIAIRKKLDEFEQDYNGKIAAHKYNYDKIAEENNKLKAINKEEKNYRNILFVGSAGLLIVLAFLVYRKRKQGKKLKETESQLQKSDSKLFEQIQKGATSNQEDIAKHHQKLKKQYGINDLFIEYWMLRAQRFTNKQIGEKLHITEFAAKKRGARLIEKIKEVDNIDNIDKQFLKNHYIKKLKEFND